MLSLHELRKVWSKSIICASCLRRQFTVTQTLLQSTVWVWSFSTTTLFRLCMILPNSVIVSTSSSLFRMNNLIYILKVKICGYKYTAKYLKNLKASVHIFFSLYMISHLIPKKAHALLYGLPSVAFSVVWVWFFSPFFSYCRICQICFHVLHSQDHDHSSWSWGQEAKEVVLFSEPWRSLRNQKKIPSFRSWTKKNDPSGPRKLFIEFLNYIRLWLKKHLSRETQHESSNRTAVKGKPLDVPREWDQKEGVIQRDKKKQTKKPNKPPKQIPTNLTYLSPCFVRQ